MSDKEESFPDLPFEIAREREVYRYYQPSSHPFTPDRTPQSSVDTALSAFAQLATLRLGARRALISLIDRNSQHILAEATQTLSLQSELVHASDDELWFGATTLPRDLGLCETALDILPPAQQGQQSWSISPLMVNDLTLDERFKDRPFVTNRPTVRFFVAMPIRTKSGFNIGTLSVYDDQPRQGLDEIQKKFLEDVTITIMAHLEMTRVKAAHRRSEKMVSGLGVFVEGRSSVRDWWLDTKNNKAWGPDDSKNVDSLKHLAGISDVIDPLVEVAGSPQLDDGPPCPVRTSSNAKPSAGATSLSTSNHLPHDPIGYQRLSGLKEPSKPLKEPVTSLQEDMLPANLKDMFSRASNIIRECIEVDGTLFLDASIGTQGGGHVVESHRRIGESMGIGESEESIVSIVAGQITPKASESVIDDADSSLQPSETAHGVQQKKCGILGFSTATKSSLTGDHAPESYVPVTETFLQTLLKKYPRGQIFDLTEGGELMPSIRRLSDSDGEMPKDIVLSIGDKTKQKEAKAIVKMLPGVRSVAFSPLWDSHHERWFAGSFAWTTLSTRVLTRTEDVNYLAAFGNSIMADVARLDAVAADQAKSDFISSISHELRSPLHGILASVEFLQETTVDLFQNSMVDTIERCGRTLLDTIQHVLDFAKINNFVKPKRKGSESAEPVSIAGLPSPQTGLSSDIDLSVATEDVIDAIYAGYEFERNSSITMARGFPSDGTPNGRMVDESGMASNPSEVKKERLEIIMDIGFRQNWFFHTQSGALRRVLMNLFCNSLKYTDAGWIKVSLQAEDIVSSIPQPAKSRVTITISDSGRGISEEFLHSNLFTPFIQEDAMNPGTGLGLSIVLQIVRSLGGTIDVKSKLGTGTEVKVILTLTQTPVLPEVLLAANYENPALKTRRKTSGLILGLSGFDEADSSATVDVSSDHSRSLKSSLERVAMLWFDVKVTPSSEWKTCPPDIFIANETPEVCGATDGTPIIVLCSNASTYRAYAKTENHTYTRDSALVHFVSKPCGPCKLAKAFKFCLSNTDESSKTASFAGDIGKTYPSELEPPLALPLATTLELGVLDSPQSLFALSPEPEYNESRLPYEYFPIGRPALPHRTSTSFQISSLNSLANARPVKRTPVLLLVEDNEINMRLLETFIRKSKFEYDTATNGLLALQAFQRNPGKYDVVFMDISMPVMNGIESTFKIRELERENKIKPAMIVALTGLASAEAQQEAFRSGLDLFLTKPVRFGDLRKLLGEWQAN